MVTILSISNGLGETEDFYCDKQKTNLRVLLRHRAQMPIGFGRYASGKKWCQICEIFIKLDGL